MTVKDAFETAGLRTTCGAPDLADHVPATDATAVGRLREAGAIVFGKTNTPTYTADLQTSNPVFGTTNNPWALDRSPGGSSGWLGRRPRRRASPHWSWAATSAARSATPRTSAAPSATSRASAWSPTAATSPGPPAR